MNQSTNIEVQTINHLGIIAGIIDEIGIVEIINEQLGIKSQEKLSSGIIIKSIILNAMGFVSRPLYLFSQFFNDKATEHLFGEDIVPEDFNDDKIGRVMDKLYQFGLTNIFLKIALSVFKKYEIDNKYSHLDSTSISLQGDYGICQTLNEENLEPTPIKIVYGYSKDKRPDLKQFLINLIASGDGGVPLFLECGNGNDNDKAKFAQLLSNFKKQVDFESIFVADSALYTADNLLVIEHLKWITRVPLSIKDAQFYVRETSDSEFIKTDREGYKAVEKESNYNLPSKYYLEQYLPKKSDMYCFYENNHDGERIIGIRFINNKGSENLLFKGRSQGRELGFIHRFKDKDTGMTVFLCVGHGSSATYGSIRYLINKWPELYLKYKKQEEFIVCLAFEGQEPNVINPEFVLEPEVIWPSKGDLNNINKVRS